MRSRIILFVLLVAAVCCLSACGLVESVTNSFSNVVGTGDTATVIAKTAEIRTSYAVVAGDLLEVKRGDRLDVVDQTDFEKVTWFRVRAHDDARTEGWIEAQNIITSSVLDKSKKLAESFQNVPSQAAGTLRAASNLRLSPDMSRETVLYKLTGGSTFEIMSWKYVPKQEVGDVGDETNGQSKQSKKTKNEEIEAAKDDDEPDKLDDKYDMWYLIRLDPSVSPAPAGWLFGRQVELQVPTDIQFYQENNRKFVAWQRLDS